MMEIGPVATWGIIKAKSPLKLFFHTLSFFFPLIVFPSAGFTPWPKDSHERGKGKGKGRVKEGKRKNRKGTGKGEEREERERKGKNRAVSHTDRFWCQKLSVSFCYRSWILCTFLFSGNGCNHQKRTVATTYQAPSLCRIWHAFVGAPLRQQTMKWRNQKH